MHASYVFIIDEIDTDKKDKELFKDIDEAFEARYGNDHCDENNWYHVYGAVTRGGRILGTSEFVERWEKEHPDVSKRLDAALRFAMTCVAVEMELFGVSSFSLFEPPSKKDKLINKMSRAELIEAIYTEISSILTKAYAGFKRDPEDSLDSEGYKRSTTARNFEMFHSAPLKPFTVGGTPYEYRCFDIRGNGRWSPEVGENDIIVMVDIHT